MRKIIIYKNRITVTQWEEQGRTWIEYDILKLEGSINRYFNRLAEIRPDVTVEDFMRHLEKHESVIDYCFSDYSKGIPLRLFLNEMENEKTDSDLGEVELFWEGEIMNGDLAIIGYLRAFLSEERANELGKDSDIPHEINFLPINVWKNCRFLLNENLMITNSGKMNEVRKDLVFEGFYRWTFFEVVSNFLGELSLNGSPDERNKLLSQMEDGKHDINEIAKNKEQAEFWLSFMSTELDDLNAAMDKALEKEEYEKASKIKENIENVEKELNDLKELIKGG